MQLQEFDRFERLIKKLSGRYFPSMYNYEDKLQELRMKVIEVYSKKKDIRKETEFQLIKTVLQNHINYLLIQESRNVEIISKLDNDNNYDDLILQLADNFDLEKEVDISYQLRTLLDIVESKDPDIKKLLNSLLDPDQELLDHWENQVKAKHSRFKNYEVIPLFTIARFYKISKYKVFELKDIMYSLLQN